MGLMKDLLKLDPLDGKRPGSEMGQDLCGHSACLAAKLFNLVNSCHGFIMEEKIKHHCIDLSIGCISITKGMNNLSPATFGK